MAVGDLISNGDHFRQAKQTLDIMLARVDNTTKHTKTVNNRIALLLISP